MTIAIAIGDTYQKVLAVSNWYRNNHIDCYIIQVFRKNDLVALCDHFSKVLLYI